MATLVGKKYIVTGGARGIGLAFCSSIVAAGGEVAILDVLPEPHPDCVALIAKGGCHYHRCDITDSSSLDLAFPRAVASVGGRIDGCVTTAGIAADKPFLTIARGEFDRVVAVNQAGTFFVTQMAVRQILSQRPEGGRVSGSIVMVASAAASHSCPGHKLTAYGGTKGFVKSFAMQLAHELAATGVRVNSISPGYVNTELNMELLRQRPELAHYFKESPPMKRLGEPEDVAGGLLFLLSDAASYITGIDLSIDGGMSTGNGLGD